MQLVGALAAILVSTMVSCSDTTAPVPITTTPATSPSDDSDLEMSPGKVSCRDGQDDVLGYSGTGDAGGPPPKSPPEHQPGTDIRGASMERSTNELALTMKTYDRIPRVLHRRAQLYFSFVGSTLSAIRRSAAVVARLDSEGWSVELRTSHWDTSGPSPQRIRPLAIDPSVDGRVLELVVEQEDIPRLMRGAFRWSSRSEWIPKPTRDAGEVYIDECPPLPPVPAFRGSS